MWTEAGSARPRPCQQNPQSTLTKMGRQWRSSNSPMPRFCPANPVLTCWPAFADAAAPSARHDLARQSGAVCRMVRRRSDMTAIKLVRRAGALTRVRLPSPPARPALSCRPAANSLSSSTMTRAYNAARHAWPHAQPSAVRLESAHSARLSGRTQGGARERTMCGAAITESETLDGVSTHARSRTLQTLEIAGV